jgi:hypothetical protein
MNLILIKISIYLLLVIAFLVSAFITKDEINSQIFTSLSIIIGVLAFKLSSPKNSKENE